MEKSTQNNENIPPFATHDDAAAEQFAQNWDVNANENQATMKPKTPPVALPNLSTPNVIALSCRSCYHRGYKDALKDIVFFTTFAVIVSLTVRHIIHEPIV